MSKRRHKGQASVLPGSASPSKTGNISTRDTPTLQNARQLWTQRRWDEALAAFNQAVAQEQNNARALVDAARAFGARYDFDRAATLLQQLVSLEDGNPIMLAHAGESYRLMSRYPEAVKCFERVCELTKGDAATQLELAALYERLHRLERAYDIAQSVVKAQSNWPRAKLIKARIERRLKLDEQAEKSLRQLL